MLSLRPTITCFKSIFINFLGKYKKLFSVLLLLTALCSAVWAAPSPKTILERLQAAPTVSQAVPEGGAYTVPAQQAAYTNAPLKAVTAADNVQTFYGFMAHSAAWDANTTGNYGIYSFPAIANTNFEKVLPTKNITAGAYADGRIRGYYVFNYLGSIRVSYYMYDADSGQLKVEKSYTPYNVSDIYAYYAYSLAYNYKDATLYGIFFRKTADDVVVVLSKVDQLTGVPTEVVELKTGVMLINAITFDDNGTLYTIGDTGKLYTVDITTGELTEVGSTELIPTDPQCAYYDNETGKDVTVEVDVPQGEHTFNVIAHNASGRGHDSMLKSFGGIDVPLPVANIRYKCNEADDNKATLLWDAPDSKGVHGLDIPSMTYSILTPAFFGSGMMDTVTGLTECTYAITTTYTAQTLAPRGVLAKSDGGKSETAMIYLNMGPAAPLDAYESFGNGATAYKTWSISMLDGQANWAMYNDNADIATAQDEDNGTVAKVSVK